MTMFETQLHSAQKLRKLLEFVAAKGEPIPQLLQGVGLDQHMLDRGDEPITHAQHIQTYRNANRMAGKRPWGLQLGRSLGLTDYGFYGYALICSPTLRKALDFSVKYHQLATPTVIDP